MNTSTRLTPSLFLIQFSLKTSSSTAGDTPRCGGTNEYLKNSTLENQNAFSCRNKNNHLLGITLASEF